MAMCMGRYFRGWHISNNLQSHAKGRVWVIWRLEEFDATLLEEHTQLLHMRVKSKSMSKEFYLTVVYGDSKLSVRKNLWRKLCELAPGITLQWLVGVTLIMY